MVLKGRVQFYGPQGRLLGDYGPHEGLLLPENSRYWFKSVGEEEAWLLQIAGYPKGAAMSKRVPVEPARADAGGVWFGLSDEEEEIRRRNNRLEAFSAGLDTARHEDAIGRGPGVRAGPRQRMGRGDHTAARQPHRATVSVPANGGNSPYHMGHKPRLRRKSKMSKSPEELVRLHDEAEAQVTTFRYAKPEGIGAGKGRVNLAQTGHLRGVVQIVKKDGGENNLHYHTNSDSRGWC